MKGLPPSHMPGVIPELEMPPEIAKLAEQALSGQMSDQEAEEYINGILTASGRDLGGMEGRVASQMREAHRRIGGLGEAIKEMEAKLASLHRQRESTKGEVAACAASLVNEENHRRLTPKPT
jgi:predicted component of type VI protein secretion system